MTHGEKAAELKKTLNCAQSVAVSLSDLCGLDEKTAAVISTGFGGGLRCGEACGAYCGAVLALSMTLGADGMGKPGGPVAVAAKELSTQFKEKLALSGGDHSVCNGFCAWCADKAAELIGK